MCWPEDKGAAKGTGSSGGAHMGKRSAARAAAPASAQQPAELGLLDGELGISSDEEAEDAAVRPASAAAAAGPRANRGAAAGPGGDASAGEADADEDSEREASEGDSDAGVSSADEAAGRSEDAELDRALVDLVAAQDAHRGSADDGEAGGGEPGPGLPQPGAAEDSDSSEDEHPSRNTGTACDGDGGVVVADPGRSGGAAACDLAVGGQALGWALKTLGVSSAPCCLAQRGCTQDSADCGSPDLPRGCVGSGRGAAGVVQS